MSEIMKLQSTKTLGAPLLLAAVATLAACASAPKTVPEVEMARAQIERVAQAPLAREAAAVRLDKAQQALKTAEANVQAKHLELAKQDAYVANRNALIAEQQIAELISRRQVEQGEAARNRVLIEAREAETARAQAAADAARAQAASATAQAASATASAQSADAQAQQLREELLAMQAKQTDRGMVITLGDVLFDTGMADLKPGALNTVERLAGFLNEHKDLRVQIEGHTDSRGSADYNLGLSERRAAAVRAALGSRGIDGTRIQARGLGKDYPVASNDTREGQQANRRVEIVFSDKEGAFPAGAQRAPVAGL
jgi:outer membrane protein OmpA-like peptidoglycan-associated protein